MQHVDQSVSSCLYGTPHGSLLLHSLVYLPKDTNAQSHCSGNPLQIGAMAQTGADRHTHELPVQTQQAGDVSWTTGEVGWKWLDKIPVQRFRHLCCRGTIHIQYGKGVGELSPHVLLAPRAFPVPCHIDHQTFPAAHARMLHQRAHWRNHTCPCPANPVAGTTSPGACAELAGTAVTAHLAGGVQLDWRRQTILCAAPHVALLKRPHLGSCRGTDRIAKLCAGAPLEVRSRSLMCGAGSPSASPG